MPEAKAVHPPNINPGQQHEIIDVDQGPGDGGVRANPAQNF